MIKKLADFVENTINVFLEKKLQLIEKQNQLLERQNRLLETEIQRLETRNERLRVLTEITKERDGGDALIDRGIQHEY